PGGRGRAAMAHESQARPDYGVGGGWLAAVGLTAAAAMGLQVLAGHAAAPSTLRPVNLLAQWLHLLAAGVWAGGGVWLRGVAAGRPPQPLQQANPTGDDDREWDGRSGAGGDPVLPPSPPRDRGA